MNIIVRILSYVLVTFLIIKAIFYGFFEIQQKNAFGGFFVIAFSSFVYIFFVLIMAFQ